MLNPVLKASFMVSVMLSDNFGGGAFRLRAIFI